MKKLIFVIFCFLLTDTGHSMDINGYIKRFLDAVGEYLAAGGIEAVERGMQINEGEVFVNRTTVFDMYDTVDAEYNVMCFRIPAIVQTSSGVLLAFAEGRIDTCADCAVLGIAMKRSFDGGLTWSNMTWPVTPNPTGPGNEMNRGGNPTAVFDSVRNQTILQFNRGIAISDCIPAVDNFQIVSKDDGLTWSSPTNISSFLGRYRGLLPGPGAATFLPGKDRVLFAGHYLTAEREGGCVVVYYSDDGGDTYTLSNNTFPSMDESVIAAVNEQELVINLRSDRGNALELNDTSCNPACTHSCHCRAKAFSSDSGATWTELEFDAALPDPICEGAMAQVGNYTVFSNPPMSFSRANLSLALSEDGGHEWQYRIRITDEFQYTDYTSILDMRTGSKFPEVGLLWGSCSLPIPMRVWCLWPNSWTIYFSRIPLDPELFVPTQN